MFLSLSPRVPLRNFFEKQLQPGGKLSRCLSVACDLMLRRLLRRGVDHRDADTAEDRWPPPGHRRHPPAGNDKNADPADAGHDRDSCYGDNSGHPETRLPRNADPKSSLLLSESPVCSCRKVQFAPVGKSSLLLSESPVCFVSLFSRIAEAGQKDRLAPRCQGVARSVCYRLKPRAERKLHDRESHTCR